MFGSKEGAKREILSHWRAANANSDEKRIRADLMETRPHDYPHSMPGLLACQAAARQGGEAAHWDYYDRIQFAHLTECRDITQDDVLIDCAEDVGLDGQQFASDLHDQQTRAAVEADLQLARTWGIRAVPSLVVAEHWLISGAQQTDQLRETFRQIAKETTDK